MLFRTSRSTDSGGSHQQHSWAPPQQSHSHGEDIKATCAVTHQCFESLSQSRSEVIEVMTTTTWRLAWTAAWTGEYTPDLELQGLRKKRDPVDINIVCCDIALGVQTGPCQQYGNTWRLDSLVWAFSAAARIDHCCRGARRPHCEKRRPPGRDDGTRDITAVKAALRNSALFLHLRPSPSPFHCTYDTISQPYLGHGSSRRIVQGPSRPCILAGPYKNLIEKRSAPKPTRIPQARGE